MPAAGAAVQAVPNSCRCTTPDECLLKVQGSLQEGVLLEGNQTDIGKHLCLAELEADDDHFYPVTVVSVEAGKTTVRYWPGYLSKQCERENTDLYTHDFEEESYYLFTLQEKALEQETPLRHKRHREPVSKANESNRENIKKVAIGTVARANSRATKGAFKINNGCKCSATSGCTTDRCPCYKADIDCGSSCHPKHPECYNKDDFAEDDAEEAAKDEDVCEICKDALTVPGKMAVYCDNCEKGFHQKCVGLKKLPKKNKEWYCKNDGCKFF